MKYQIPNLNEGGFIENPTIEIVGLSVGNPRITDMDFPTLKYAVDVRLYSVGYYDFIINLTNVTAESWDLASQGANMPQQVLTCFK